MLKIKNSLCIEDTQRFIKWYYMNRLNVANVLDIKYSFITDTFEILYLVINDEKILEHQKDTIHKMDIVNLMERFKEYNPWIF